MILNMRRIVLSVFFENYKACCVKGLTLTFISMGFAGFANTNPSSPESSLPIWKIVSPTMSRTAFFAFRSNWVLMDFDSARFMLEEHSLRHLYLTREQTQENSQIRIKVNKLLRVSGAYGLVLFEVDHHVEKPFSFRESPLFSNEDLFVTGYSNGALQFFKKIAGINYSNPLVYQFPINTWGIKESIGGPILDSEDQVVGVVKDIDMNILVGIKVPPVLDFIGGGMGLKCPESISAKECVKREIDNLVRIAFDPQEVHIKYQILSISLQDSSVPVIYRIELAALLRVLAEVGYPLAQYGIGRSHFTGRYFGENWIQVEQSYTEAWDWFEKSSHLLQSQFYKGLIEGMMGEQARFLFFVPSTGARIPNSILDSAVHGLLLSHLILIKQYNLIEEFDGVQFWCRVLKEREIIPPVYKGIKEDTIVKEWNDVVPVCRSVGYEMKQIIPKDTPPTLPSSEETHI